MLSATIYIPIIEPAWLAFEDSFVELYYVLRNFVLNSTPMIIPLVKGESSEMLNSSADGKKKALLDGLRQSCFHLCWDCSAMEMAVKLVNLLREIGESIPARSVAVGVPTGRSLSGTVQRLLGSPPELRNRTSAHKPRSPWHPTKQLCIVQLIGS